jgi:VWFA-related protein
MLKMKRAFIFFAVFFAFCLTAFSQTPTPTPDRIERIAAEEIKLNVLAFNENNEFAANLTAEDVVIIEDGRLHQATSLRRVPASVLLVLDVGNEISYAKRNKATAETARSLVSALQADDSVAVIQYGDRVDVLSDWTNNKAQVSQVLTERKLGFGKRSSFVYAMQKAVEFFDKTPMENRHLILITDGVDSFNDRAAVDAVTRKLLSSDINVHVISYTKLQQDAIQGALKTKNAPPQINLPPGAEPPHSKDTRRFPIGPVINLDREMTRKRKADIERLKASEAFLTTIAEDTNGDIFLPDTTEEMIAKTMLLAKNIDSHYVVTYVPKRPLDEAREGETRLIEVTSRKPGVSIQGRRKFVVTNR